VYDFAMPNRLASHKILLIRIINVKIQIHAKQSHDKALIMVLE